MACNTAPRCIATATRVLFVAALLACVAQTTLAEIEFSTAADYDVPELKSEFSAREPKASLEPKQGIRTQLFGVSHDNTTEISQDSHTEVAKTAKQCTLSKSQTRDKQCTDSKSQTCDKAAHNTAWSPDKQPMKQSAMQEQQTPTTVEAETTNKVVEKAVAAEEPAHHIAPTSETQSASDDTDSGAQLDAWNQDLAAYSLQVVFQALLEHRNTPKDEDTIQEHIIEPFKMFDEDGDGRISFASFRELLTSGVSKLTDTDVNQVQMAIIDAIEEQQDADTRHPACQTSVDEDGFVISIDDDGQIHYECIAYALFV